MSPNLLLVVGALVFAAVLLRLNLWRAVLFLRPSRVAIEQDAPPDQMKLPESLIATAKELTALGFEPIGSRYEKTALAPPFISYDYASAPMQAFASLYPSKFGRPRLYFLTPVEGGGFVITANFRRPSRKSEARRYLAGGLPNIPMDRLVKAHHKRLEGYLPIGTFTFQARLDAARAWFDGPGRGEIRQQNLSGLVSTVLSVALLGLAARVAVAFVLWH
jgi:hypothetical protein